MDIKSKASNFTTVETNVLLEGIRANYQALFSSGSGQHTVTPMVRNEIWQDITRAVNATGSGEHRTADQVRLRWKNLKQRATRDMLEARTPPAGSKLAKRGEFTDYVLDIVDGESSRAFHGFVPVCLGESIKSEPLDICKMEMIPIIPPDPDTEDSGTSQNLSHDTEEEERIPSAKPPVHRRKRCYEEEQAYEKLLRVEIERAQEQISLTKEQRELTLLKQEEVKLRIQLLQKQLQD